MKHLLLTLALCAAPLAAAPQPAAAYVVPLTQSITTTWKDDAGNTHSVTTVRNDGEGYVDWMDRHSKAVTAAQIVYPPAGG